MITLVTMLVGAALVALVVDRAARRAEQAAQARTEVALLASFSRTVLTRTEPRPRLLDKVREGVRARPGRHAGMGAGRGLGPGDRGRRARLWPAGRRGGLTGAVGVAGEVVCPGCGVALPPSGWLPDRRLNASPECWQVHGEVVGFESQHLELVGRFHQLTVDAYGAQHAGGPTKPIRVAYSLVGLHLALECGFSGLQVRDAHQQMGKPAPWWPDLPRPPGTGALTVLDVASAGARAASVEGHARLVARWAAGVWAAWADQHDDVAALTRRLRLV